MRSATTNPTKSSTSRYAVLPSGENPTTFSSGFTNSTDDNGHSCEMIPMTSIQQMDQAGEYISKDVDSQIRSADESETPENPKVKLHPSTESIWRRFRQDATVICIAVALAVFLLNLICTIWVIGRNETRSSLPAMYIGQCDSVKTMDTWVHLAINVLASALLGASNHVMQTLCAPSRAEIDTAHRKCQSLTISSSGLQSLGGRRFWIWLLLWASSMPIHLL